MADGDLLDMPLIGFGTGSLHPKSRETLPGAIRVALENGCRLFDTAYVYQNEDILGEVLEEWIDSGKVKREELYIITKLPPIGMEKSRVEHFLDLSLKALKLTYVDLYLMHFPIGCLYDGDDSKCFPFASGEFLIDSSTSLETVWEGMEAVKVSGKARSIGISNFNKGQINRLLKSAQFPPSVLEIETHVYFQQKELRQFCAANGIRVCAYAPLGSPGKRTTSFKSGVSNLEVPSGLQDPKVNEIALAHGKLPSQVLLRMLTQQEITVIPNSSCAERIQQNVQSLDFDLSEEELGILSTLDKGEAGRMFTMSNFTGFEKHPEFPYK